jgi:DNA-binding NarL/FixJ family response regulator
VVTGSYDSVKMAATTGRKSHTDVLMADAGPGESEARHVADQLTKYFPEARDRAILLIGTLGTPTIIRLIRSGVRTMVRRDGPVESIYHAVQAAHHRDTLFADGVLDTVLDHLPYRLPMEASDLPATAGLTKSERILSQWWPTAYPT